MEEGVESFPKAGKALLPESLEFSGQRSHVRETDMEPGDVGQNNPAVPVPNCTAMGVPPNLPDPLESGNKTPVSQSAYEGANDRMTTRRVMRTSGPRAKVWARTSGADAERTTPHRHVGSCYPHILAVQLYPWKGDFFH